ncbi:MAG: SMC-Scp complex subunit ScpB [Oscillibacter sp.]|nr:SMC-Scp complex subunit ScpB [Oscillibacter sp.]
MEPMEIKEIESAVEGILFASGEPVHIDRICVALEMDRPTVEQVLQKLMDHYAYERRGIRLIRIEDSWQMCSSPDYADVIRKAFEIRKPAKLSQPALEVLTIIAYYQPTTRAYVDQIRGVDSSYTMGLLQERNLIEECGRLQVPGRPRQYRTTKQFLRAFHLTSLEDLPEMPDLGGEGQMRLDDNGDIIDPMEKAEIIGADTPDEANFPVVEED